VTQVIEGGQSSTTALSGSTEEAQFEGESSSSGLKAA
jgi:isocitrate lyase